MADEPTGALDSNTGKQVLDTKKKLSKEKLVIVVSHDQEFANQYADRIIELKDGKIISDYTKQAQKAQSFGNITKIDKNAIYSGAFIFNNKDSNMFKQLLSESQTRNYDDSILNINNSVFDSLSYVDSFFEIMTNIFLYAGIILALFSTLLLFNFISISITNKKKEIGILRAVGAIIYLLLSLISSYLCCNLINNKLGEGLNGISLLVFGGKSIILLIALSLIVGFTCL